MTMQEVIAEIKLELTGYILDVEIDDTTIESVVKKSMRELERYWDETTLVTIPFSSCIDLANSELDLKEKVSTIVKVYRTDAIGETTNMGDPAYMQQWMLFSNGGTMYNLNDYILNFSAWNTLLRIKNTMSTDLSFIEDKHNNKLYINHYLDTPSRITVEYIPKLTDIEAIKSEYWIDILIKMSTAMTKIVLGRIRTRFTQSNPLWTQDGEKLLEEGNSERKELLEILRTNSNLIYDID